MLHDTHDASVHTHSPLYTRRPPSLHPLHTPSKQMLATLAADPVASLVDTAFVGRLGAAQLAGACVCVLMSSVPSPAAHSHPCRLCVDMAH